MGLLSGDGRLEIHPRVASREDLLAFHSERYLDALRAAAGGELTPEHLHMGLGTPDCPVFREMYNYPALASGATLTGAELIVNQEAQIAFNPSGGFHHAGPESASGFCYMNDCVLGCMKLAEAGKKVFYADLDVHHGDGVQNAFYDRSDVFTYSMHESGRTLFPGTGSEDEIGEGEGRGFTANVPLPAGTYDGAWLHALRSVCLPLIHAYEPDVLVLELGMDALSGDPLAHLSLTNNAYAEAVELLMAFGKPILAVGGGGYNVENTTRGWALMWSVLSGAGPHSDMALGLGGVMLETTEWHGGLRDRALLSDAGQRERIDAEINKSCEKLRRTIFPIHRI